MCLEVFFIRAGQQLGGAVGNEAAELGEKWQRRVEALADDVAAHAFQHRVAHLVAHELPFQILHAQAPLSFYEVAREALGFIIGKVVPVPQPDAHRLAAGHLMHETQQSLHRFPETDFGIEDLQHLKQE